MSKMFDELRRAESKRRQQAQSDESVNQMSMSGAGAESVKPTVEPAGMDPMVNEAVADLPEEFVRELGILRNSLETALPDKEKRVVLFTSSSHDEGTTTLAASYARVLASHARQRVLLVELNARRPSLFWKLGLSSEIGITHYWSDNRPLTSVVQTTELESLDVITVGQNDPAAIQIGLVEGLPRLAKEAVATYDTVIIDAPPVVGSPETPPMTAHVDGVVLVVHAGKTKREIVQRSIGMIDQFDGNVLGVVLNRKKYFIPDFIYKRI